jgi:hypothetical protein
VAGVEDVEVGERQIVQMAKAAVSQTQEDQHGAVDQVCLSQSAVAGVQIACITCLVN